MGCCFSRPSPYANEQPTASSTAINPNAGLSSNTRPPTVACTRAPGSSASNIRKNLQLPIWRSTTRTWTRSQLRTEREAFFDTRVTGRPEIWQAIQTALEVVWSGGGPDDHDGGLATATQILDAVEIIRPQGDLSSGVYDSFGNFYQLPKYVCCNPTQLIETPAGSIYGKEEGNAEEFDDEEIPKRRNEKGKEVAKPGQSMCVRARLSNCESGPIDLQVMIEEGIPVRILHRQIYEASMLTPPSSIRLFYMGFELESSKPLGAQNWKDGHIITVMVFKG